MDIQIKVSQEEREAVIAAIQYLDNIGHLKYMSQAAIAEQANLKATKVRAVLQELVNDKTITQYNATENPRRQRFYYVINQEA